LPEKVTLAAQVANPLTSAAAETGYLLWTMERVFRALAIDESAAFQNVPEVPREYLKNLRIHFTSYFRTGLSITGEPKLILDSHPVVFPMILDLRKKDDLIELLDNSPGTVRLLQLLILNYLRNAAL
jgi:hypothetical protein